MLAAAWLLAAVELNGALISRGAQVQLSERDCSVEVSAIAKALSAEHLAGHRRGLAWSVPAEHCSFDESEGLLKIRLPQQALASRTLTLGQSSGLQSIALLHDALPLDQQPELLTQPPARVLPSAALDLFAGSDLMGAGLVLARGPLSVTAIEQRTKQFGFGRASAEYFFANGAQIRVGDFRSDTGVEQRFGEFQGLLATNRAPALRGDGKAEAPLAIHSPSRVQFFDRNGVAVFSSEILPPGNYVIQGYGASTVPGFLEARLVDVNGVIQTVALPWSADRRLLSPGKTEWEVFVGRPRQFAAELTSPALASARLRWGLHEFYTVGLHAERLASRHRQSLELNSRALPSILATAAIGQSCEDHGCTLQWFAEARATLNKRLTGILAASDLTPITSGAQPQRAVQITLSGAITPLLTGNVHLIAQFQEAEPDQRITAVSLQRRLSSHASLQLQARHHLLAGDRGWSGLLGFSYSFARHHTSVSSALSMGSNRVSPNQGPDLRVSANLNSPSLYGPQINAAQSTGHADRTDVFARYASPYGDGSMRADSVTNKLSWSASTRLWMTSEAFLFAPAGEDNLVIQHIGQPAVRLRHGGRDTQVADTQGRVIFRKAPPWTDSIYTVDPKSLPFGATLAAYRAAIPLANNRAYLVDYRGLWSRARHWRILAPESIGLTEAVLARDRHGRPVFVTADGYADLQSADSLPLSLQPKAHPSLLCTLMRPPAAHETEALLTCTDQQVL